MNKRVVREVVEARLRKDVDFDFEIVSVRQKGPWAVVRVEPVGVNLDGVDVLVRRGARGPEVVTYGSDLGEWRQVVPAGLLNTCGEATKTDEEGQ